MSRSCIESASKGLMNTVEFLGYIVRATSIEQRPRYSLGPYVAGMVLVLIAPTLFAASIYMALGRIITVIQADGHSLVRTSWLTKIFIAGDVASFITQGVGAIIISNQTAEDMTRGANIITIGLAVQIFFFTWLILTCAVFHWRTNWQPTDRSRNPGVPWKQHILTLYLVSTLILIRCIYRFVEYRTQQSANGGYLLSHEWCAYAFDAMLMFFVMLLFFVRHPSEINALRHPRGGIAMRYLSGRPVGAVNDHWRVLPPPNMSDKMMYEPGAKVKRMSVHLPRSPIYAG